MGRNKVTDIVKISVISHHEQHEYSCNSSGSGSSTPSSNRSSLDEAEQALKYYRTLKHNARLEKIPLVGVVVVLALVILLAPVAAVWGLNMKSMAGLSDSRRTEALLRRSEFTAERMRQKFQACEGVIRCSYKAQRYLVTYIVVYHHGLTQ